MKASIESSTNLEAQKKLMVRCGFKDHKTKNPKFSHEWNYKHYFIFDEDKNHFRIVREMILYDGQLMPDDEFEACVEFVMEDFSDEVFIKFQRALGEIRKSKN